LKSHSIQSIPGSHNDPRFASKNNPFDAHPIHSTLNNLIRFGSLTSSFDSAKFDSLGFGYRRQTYRLPHPSSFLEQQ